MSSPSSPLAVKYQPTLLLPTSPCGLLFELKFFKADSQLYTSGFQCLILTFNISLFKFCQHFSFSIKVVNAPLLFQNEIYFLRLVLSFDFVVDESCPASFCQIQFLWRISRLDWFPLLLLPRSQSVIALWPWAHSRYFQ